jgi:NADPH:quinone reductase-like Zn-dependent oxidoreductase
MKKLTMASTLPNTCRSWQYTKTHGGIEKHMKINRAAPVPSPKPHQHLVQVIAAALNPVDYKPVEGLPLVKRLATPHAATPGLDFAGVVVKPAQGSNVKKGEIVFGVAGPGTPFAGGALSEYAISGEANCVPMPGGVDPVDAATVGVAGLTAYQSIIPHVKKGDKVFINGGSGGTGCFGIQIAKAHGCYVATTCSSKNVELCQSLGADSVIDYTKGKVWQQLKKTGLLFDHVIDNIGNDSELYFECHNFTRPGALFVMVGGSPGFGMIFGGLSKKYWPGVIGGGKRKYTGFFPHPENADLRQIGTWMKEGKVKAIVDQKFAFEQAPDAFTRLKTGRARGKIVVDVASESYGRPVSAA